MGSEMCIRDSVWTLSVGTALGLHLEHAQVKTKLYLVPSVGAPDPSHRHLSLFVGPVVENVLDVKAHLGCTTVARLSPKSKTAPMNFHV